jgi:hypothetical protein
VAVIAVVAIVVAAGLYPILAPRHDRADRPPILDLPGLIDHTDWSLLPPGLKQRIDRLTDCGQLQVEFDHATGEYQRAADADRRHAESALIGYIYGAMVVNDCEIYEHQPPGA